MRPSTILLALAAFAATLALAPEAGAAGTASAAQAGSVAALRASIGAGAIVDIDPVTSTPRVVANRSGFLTAPARGAAAEIALSYVMRHLDAFGLTPESVAQLRFVKDYVDVGGTHHITWAQRFGGIEAFDSFLRAAVTSDGRLVNVTGSPLRTAGTTSLAPRVSAETALGVSLRAARGSGLPLRVSSHRGDAARTTAFSGGSSARLTLLAVAGGAKLGWLVNAKASSQSDSYDVVDASSGALLHRSNMVSLASGTAWDYYPSDRVTSGGGTQTLRTYPAAWGPSSSTKLEGNFVHVYKDAADDNTPAAIDEVPASSGTTWSYPFTPYDGITTNWLGNCSSHWRCSWDANVAGSWSVNANQNAAQVFYFVNKFHDHLAAAPIGFTPAAGNFEGTDKVQAQVDDGAATGPDAGHLNRESMTTGPDGTPPQMQLSLFTGFGVGPDANGGDDASLVYHEYTHGLSHRLVSLANGIPALNGLQANAMGEGWSDWYALDYLTASGFDADTATVGDVSFGIFLSGGDANTFRSEPIDCPVSPLVNPAPDGSCNGGLTPHYGGYTYADLGKIAGHAEAHADGEIWAQTLWQLRRALGSSVTETLITRAMELSPTNPSMLDMRDAILQADVVNYAGAHKTVLWSVFAQRGMGVWATTNGTDDTHPVADTHTPAATGGGTLTGTITNALDGSPLQGATVTLGGMSGQTDSSGHYTIAGIPPHAYIVRASKPGYSNAAASTTIVNGANSQSLAIKRNWVSSNGGATLASFSAPDNSAAGCGPYSAIDDSLASGWASDAGTRQITVHLPQAVNLATAGGIAIDPKSTCGDPAAASLASYKVETSANGTSFSQVASGAFAAANNGHLNAVNPAGATNGVNYVRLTMLSSQGASTHLDLSELQVYGLPVGVSTPPPTISGFTPTSGKTRTLVTITGTNLGTATAVKYGTLPMIVSTKSATEIKAFVWDFATYFASAKISVTTPGGTAASATNFTITLGISGVNPQTGPAGTSVVVRGIGFDSSSVAKFNGTTASSVLNSPTQLTATVPAAATTGKITVTNTTGVTGTVTSWWTFTKT
ncbi:MAG: hypothetical protein QOE36_1701 [Gaiellaceae bacterium]|nr:hypothetical protein [Gaiellaceae bacterium]